MAISKHIIDLVNLALADRVLTFKERETIVKEAVAENISELEINTFLNNALARRLSTFTKEELKSCPSCGAQIPLITDQCPFCGSTFEKRQSIANITGEVADIIRAENQKTVEPDSEPKLCPNCGAPFPLISNICTHCGHVHHARQDSDINIKNLIDNISHSVSKIQFAYKPSAFSVLLANKGTLLVIFSLALLISSFSYPGGWGICAFVVAIPLVFWGIILNRDDHSPVKTADEMYYTALNERNMYVRLVQQVYGDNAEAKKYLAQLGSEIKKVESNKRKNRLIITIVVVLLFLSMLFPLVVKPSAEKYIDNNIDKEYSIFKSEQPSK